MTQDARVALALFRRSVLKRQKWRAIRRMLGDTRTLRCLDIGADNGVISYLLRAEGGRWASSDLDAEAVAAIRALVGSDVVQLNGGRMPFPDAGFDRVVIVDCLEHVRDDRAFVRELARVTTPDSELLVNVPLRKESWLRRFRLAIGQTDEAHGHVRPGYTLEELRAVLNPSFELTAHQTYSKFFSQAVDTLMTWAIRTVKPTQAGVGSKGTVVTTQDLSRHRKLFFLYSVCYPLVWLLAQGDRLLWFRSGYMLLAKAKRAGSRA